MLECNAKLVDAKDMDQLEYVLDELTETYI